MMKSVALTESYFVHCDDNDYVVVDTPVVSQNHAVVDVMTSIYDEVNDDSTTGSSIDDEGIYGKDTDDASYDYCDEFLTVEKIQNPSTIRYASNDDTANPTVLVPFEVDLSLLLVVDDDVESQCPPSITEDDTAVDIVVDTEQYAAAAAVDDDVDKEEIDEPVRNNSSMSDMSISKQDNTTTSQTGCSENGDVPNDDRTFASAVEEEKTDETNVTCPNVESVFPESESTDLLPITAEENQGDDANHPPHTINNNEMIVTSTDAEADVADFPSSNIMKPVQATASETKTITQDDGEWIESSSRYRRMSNKKRRKQMKLAKRTSAAMAHLSLSSSKPPSTSTKGLIIRRCGGKQVTPIIVEMSNTVIGM